MRIIPPPSNRQRMGEGQQLFGCRQCHNLTYKCQKEHNRKVDVLMKNPVLFDRLCNNVEMLDVKTLAVLLKACMRVQERYINLFGSENIGRII